MSTLSASQIAAYAHAAGFRGERLATAVAVALAESGGRTDALSPPNSDGSRDRGLWQINSRWHRNVSDQDAYNPAAAARHAYRISSGGMNWTPWSVYKSGAYKAHLPAARQAVARGKLTGYTVTGGAGAGAGAVTAGTAGTAGTADAASWRDGIGAFGVPNPLNNDKLLDDLNPLDSLSAPLDAVRALVGFATAAFTWISDPHNWLRVFLVIGGGAGVAVSMWLIASGTPAGEAIKSTATTMIPVGRAAKAATKK